MISASEKRQLLNREPCFEDITNSLRATGSQPKGIINEARDVVAIARKFADEVVRPQVLDLDLKITQDHDYLPWEFVQQANDWGLYTLFIPRIFGGQGYNISTVGFFVEEIASVCLAMGNLIGVHYLGYIKLIASWNMKMINRLSREVVKGEKSKKPCLLSLAMTEPNAGTDSQNSEFMNTGNLGCHARKVEGGYLINGTKIFISCGHLSTWHLVHAYTDLDRAAENTVMLAVKTGTKGFSFGRTEKKMGQKGSIASELIFNDCFVPAGDVCIENEQTNRLSRSFKETNAQIFAYIWSTSRAAGVGYMGVAAARGAFEQALGFASAQKIDGTLLINQEWCQGLLARMYMNVAVARTACFEGTQACAMHGLWRILNIKPIYYLIRYTPAPVLDMIFNRLCETPFMTWLFRKLCFNHQKNEEIDRIDGWGSLAKVAGTDAGIKNCHMALELMGQAGLRHDQGMEKILRDAKLLQIYEGTNEVNRINVFKRLIARSCDHAVAFSPSNI
jgi:alkylation response protein AidB-like acyl-CoA dehydrogenase